MRVLDALNTILPYMQSPTVTSVDSMYPTVGAITMALDTERGFLLDRAYWFQVRSVVLPLTPDNKIETPEGIRGLYASGTTDSIEIRGEYLYNLSTSSYFFTGELECTLFDDLSFEEVPEFAAQVIMWKAAQRVYIPRFGTDDVAQILLKYEQDSVVMLHREHLRKQKYTTLNSRAATKIINSLRGL